MKRLAQDATTLSKLDMLDVGLTDFSGISWDGLFRESKSRRRSRRSDDSNDEGNSQEACQSTGMATKLRTSAGGHTHHDLVRLLKKDMARSQCLVSAFLEHMEDKIARNDSIVLPTGQIFMPDISVGDFIRRITALAFASPSSYVVGLVYLDRLEKIRGGGMKRPLITSETYQRLVLTATMLATKFQEDQRISHKDWAAIGGISTQVGIRPPHRCMRSVGRYTRSRPTTMLTA